MYVMDYCTVYYMYAHMYMQIIFRFEFINYVCIITYINESFAKTNLTVSHGQAFYCLN